MKVAEKADTMQNTKEKCCVNCDVRNRHASDITLQKDTTVIICHIEWQTPRYTEIDL